MMQKVKPLKKKSHYNQREKENALKAITVQIYQLLQIIVACTVA